MMKRRSAKMKKILLPVERIKEEYKVINEAVEIAKKFDSTLTIFYVNDFKKKLPWVENNKYTGEGIVSEFDASIKKQVVSKEEMIDKNLDISDFMNKIEKMYEVKGVKTELKEIEGDPAEEILDEAENGDYSMIIMRTHDMKNKKRFLLGSVTNKVVHHISIPILVVR
jgi:nucleotide-binding universal stress UspA family protein